MAQARTTAHDMQEQEKHLVLQIPEKTKEKLFIFTCVPAGLKNILHAWKKSGNPISRCETTVQEHKDSGTITSFFAAS